MAMRGALGMRQSREASGAARERPSSRSMTAATSYTVTASPMVIANTDTQSNVRHAGTTPVLLKAPRVGLMPTMLFKPAGTRPEPAVSVPSANGTRPRATTEAEPELDPPDTNSALNVLVEIGRAHV